MSNGEVAAGAILLAVLAALGWSFLASLWASFLENFIPLVFVALALAAASGWSFLGRNGDGARSDSGAAGGRQPPPGQGRHAARRSSALSPPPQQLGGPEGGFDASQEQQEEAGTQNQPRHSRRDSRVRPLPPSSGQVVELARISGNGRARSRRVVTTAPGEGSASSGRGASLKALVPAPDDGPALVNAASFSCPKPHGCGFRHSCHDLQRSWMACDKHHHHPAPPDGSVWREVVPDGQPSAGSHHLLLSWGGRVLDATELGQCRGWDRQITDISTALLHSGTRVARMCSQSHRFPRLEKMGELLTMDPRAAARGQRLWRTLERWLGRKQQGVGVQLAAIASPPTEPS